MNDISFRTLFDFVECRIILSKFGSTVPKTTLLEPSLFVWRCAPKSLNRAKMSSTSVVSLSAAAVVGGVGWVVTCAGGEWMMPGMVEESSAVVDG